jgi:hypothetical protein
MLKFVTIFLVCLTALPTFSQSTSKWVVGTITDVRIHQSPDPDDFGTVSYDVSVKVGQHGLCCALHASAGGGDCEVRWRS